MTVYEQLKSDLKTAMRARDKETISTLRMTISALDNERISNKGDLSEVNTITVLTREVKRRREAAEAFRGGGKLEAAEKEEREEGLLLKYLPRQLTSDEISEVVLEAIEATGAESKSDFGKVMGYVMPRVKGKADGNAVREAVQRNLS